MRLHLPDYYGKFKCIGGDCPDSCCLGWRTIGIDAATYEKYMSLEGDFARRLRSQIKSIGGKYFFRLENGRCPFLNEKNLCDIFINIGQDMLCTTCATFPRFVYDRDGQTYASIAMACPHAANIIISGTSTPRFYVYDNNERYEERFAQIELLYDGSSLPLWMKLALLALIPVGEESYYGSYAANLKSSLEKFPAHKDIRIQIGVEYLTLFSRLVKNTHTSGRINQALKKYRDKWNGNFAGLIGSMTELYDRYAAHLKGSKDVEKEFKNYIAYRLYRSIPNVRNFEEFYEYLSMAVISSVAIFLIEAMLWQNDGSITREMRVNIFQCHAKTFEHSEKMQKKTMVKFKNDGYMTPAVMLALLVP